MANWFGGNNTQKPAAEKEAVVQADALLSLSNLEPQYTSSARTRAVRKNDTLTEYRRAEKMPNGKWKVLKVEIYDYSAVHTRAAQSLDIENTDSIEKKVAVDVTSMKVTNREGKESAEFSYIQAMAFLANLEYDVVKKNSGYVYATDSDVADSIKFVKIDETNEFIAKDFADVEHFVTSSEREGIIWTHDAVPKLSKHGRLVEDGTYMIDDVQRGNSAKEKADKNPPSEGSPDGILAAAFMAVSDKNSLESTLRAYDVIADMDQLFGTIAQLTRSYITFFGNMGDAKALRAVNEKINACELQCDDVNKSIGAYVERYKEILLRTRLSANVGHMKWMLDEIKTDPSSVKIYKPEIDALQNENMRLIEQSGISKNFESVADAMVTPDTLKSLVESYNQYRLEWRKKVEARPDAAMEKSKTFADVRNGTKKLI